MPPPMNRSFGRQLLLAFDQLANVLAQGWADETISARAYRQRHKLRWRWAMHGINAFFFWQKEHCRLAYLAEVHRFQQPPEFRGE